MFSPSSSPFLFVVNWDSLLQDPILQFVKENWPVMVTDLFCRRANLGSGMMWPSLSSLSSVAVAVLFSLSAVNHRKQKAVFFVFVVKICFVILFSLAAQHFVMVTLKQTPQYFIQRKLACVRNMHMYLKSVNTEACTGGIVT